MLPTTDDKQTSKSGAGRNGGLNGAQGERMEDQKVELGAGGSTERKKRLRERLPTMLKAPLDALFPRITPSILYPSDKPIPSFLSDAAARTAWRSRKHLFRAMLVLLASLILVLNKSSLTVLGQASFFGMIVSVMLPPTFPAQVFLLVASMLVLGMCFGWAWGCAAMAAALKARDRVLLASSLQRVQAGLAGATNPDAQYRTSIFAGEFLDARSTIVFSIFLFVGLFFFGYLRAKSPKAILVALFASIVLDVMCSYGPLFPFAQYTLATTFLIPTACFIAMAIVANLIIFPETLNYSWTRDLVDTFLSPVLQRSHLHSKLLATSPPSFHDVTERGGSTFAPPPSPWTPFTAIFAATQASASASLEGLLGSIPMLELEVSYGKLSSKDLSSLVDALREVHVRSIGLGVLFNIVQSRYKRFASLQPSTSSSSTSESTEKPSSAFLETERMQRMRERLGAAEHVNQHDLNSLLPLLDTASADLRYATDAALEGSMAWLTVQNKSRWSRSSKDSEPKLAAVVAQLEVAIEAYRSDGRRALVEPFRDFFDDATGQLKAHHPRDVARGEAKSEKPVFSPGSLFTLLSSSDNLVVFSTAILSFAKKVEELQVKRTTNRLWVPTGLRKLGKLFKGGRADKALADGENPDRVDVDDEEGEDDDATLHSRAGEKVQKSTKEKKDERDGALNPDARPPKNAFQRFTFAIYRFLHFFTSPEAIFALKYATFSIAIWVPQICKSTSLLMYEEKSLWALIMFQTGLAVYSGDQILSSLQKLAGTACGLIFGMFLWYFGACSTTSSNPYGLGAVVVVFMTPMMAIRIYAPPASSQMAIQAAVTSILIVGYSWQDTYLPAVGNPGVGYVLAWKRALLVMIGTGVAAVAMLLPPVSTRTLVRRTHATCINELGRLYTTIVSSWIQESAADSDTESTPFSPTAQKTARARMLALRVKLNSTAAAIEQAGYEVGLRGDFPADEYTSLLALQLQMLQALGLLGQALVRMSPEWRRALVHETAFLNQPLIADVTSTFALLSLALRQGSPLPQAMPGPLLDRLLLHDTRLRLLSSSSSDTSPSPTSSADSAAAPAEIEGARVGSFNLIFQTLSCEQFGTYASALQALASILLDLDASELAVKKLVGEVKFPGYEALQRV